MKNITEYNEFTNEGFNLFGKNKQPEQEVVYNEVDTPRWKVYDNANIHISRAKTPIDGELLFFVTLKNILKKSVFHKFVIKFPENPENLEVNPNDDSIVIDNIQYDLYGNNMRTPEYLEKIKNDESWLVKKIYNRYSNEVLKIVLNKLYKLDDYREFFR